MKVQALVGTRNRPAGLACVLCCLAAQVRLPDELTIVNTGEPVSDPFVWAMINYASQYMPVELVSIENHTHLGKLRMAQFRYARNTTWLLDDDLIFDANCLELQTKLALQSQALPNVAIEVSHQHEDAGRTELDANSLPFISEPYRIASGSFHGLLATAESLQALDLSDWPYLEDVVTNQQLRPWVVPGARMWHVMPFGEHSFMFKSVNQLAERGK